VTPSTPDQTRSRVSRRARALRSSQIRDLLDLTRRPGIISLAGGLPDPAGFPSDRLAAAAADVLLTDPSRALQYGPTEGDPALRALVAEMHTVRTGRPTRPDQVLVTTGSQQGLDLLARVLADPGDPVVVEDPGYLGALQAFQAAGLHLVAVPVAETGTGTRDRTGMDLDALDHLLGDADLEPAFVYTVPSFQNPTGTSLAASERDRLARLADHHDVLVIEDTPYADLDFTGSPPPPVAAHTDRVVTLGTVSKTLAPGLRVGWIVGPTWLIAAATRAKQAVDLHTSALGQALAVDLLADTVWFTAHLGQVTARYADRAATLHASLHQHLGEAVECAPARGGMFLWARLPGVDTTALLPRAVDHGTAFVPGPAFAVDANLADRLRLSFATTDGAGLVEAVARLAAALDGVRSEPPAA
jgi:2-aminoadipate transaminase